ncbi:MAG: trypsin-like peptidase domain-containing protein [Candidatus Spechtbacterales bacterium]|nr:trypsin-like peptidase domain-containing protein [Candidatus Spechtbacterales bacterium]
MQNDKKHLAGKFNNMVTTSAIGILIASFIVGFGGGWLAYYTAPHIASNSSFLQSSKINSNVEENDNAENSTLSGIEERIIETVDNSLPAVVSVIATKDLPIIENYSPFGDLFPGFQIPQQRGTEERQVSAGTGFVAANNLIVTNRHVVADTEANYTVITSEGKKLEAEILTRDPVEDLAIISVPDLNIEPLALGDSENIKRGQLAITIGNALGEFENSISLGIISGLSRTLTASSGFESEVLREVIQTDAAINPGNSGGPLLNANGEVIGVNVARAARADNIGFAIPINRIKNTLQQIEQTGNAKYPFLGIRYILINPEIQRLNNLPFDYGALVVRGDSPGEIAVVPGSSADKAGIVENDILLEINGEKITQDNPLGNIINQYEVGEEVSLKIYHKGDTEDITVTLGERP